MTDEISRNVTILYFASLREAVGIAREVLRLPVGVDSAGDLRAWLAERGGAWREALGDGRNVQVAIDQFVAQWTSPIRDGAEVAFFPPVTGG
jgi:molybdopterin synthase sulfur carrier subunit